MIFRPPYRQTLPCPLGPINYQFSQIQSLKFHLFIFIMHSSQSPFPRHIVHRAVPISVSIALGHASANAVKDIAGGWSTGSSASLTFPLHSHMLSAR